MLDHVIMQLHLHRKDADKTEWDRATSLHGLAGKAELTWDSFGGDLYCVLQDKCDDPEAISRIRSCRGEGIKALCALYKWYVGKSGQELQAKAQYVMRPPIPKNEGEIAAIM